MYQSVMSARHVTTEVAPCSRETRRYWWTGFISSAVCYFHLIVYNAKSMYENYCRFHTFVQKRIAYSLNKCQFWMYVVPDSNSHPGIIKTDKPVYIWQNAGHRLLLKCHDQHRNVPDCHISLKIPTTNYCWAFYLLKKKKKITSSSTSDVFFCSAGHVEQGIND